MRYPSAEDTKTIENTTGAVNMFKKCTSVPRPYKVAYHAHDEAGEDATRYGGNTGISNVGAGKV